MPPGPLPKRSAERRRRNRTGDVDTIEVIGRPRPPRAPREWDPLAKAGYKAITESPQAQAYFIETDWHLAIMYGTLLNAELTCGGSGTVPIRRIRRQSANSCPRCGRVVAIEDRSVAGTDFRVFKQHRPRGFVAERMNVIDSISKRLLMSEADRRQLRIEVVFVTQDEPTAPTSLPSYRARMQSAPDEVPDEDDDITDDDE